jgi:nitrogenase iron protein NifH
MAMQQTRIVVFGKGGVGKSTFATNLSAFYALQGRKVLHIGCDPKADSSYLLLESAQQPRTVVSLLSDNAVSGKPTDIINRGRHGIDCIEVGGPEAGIGCGGRGIARALEFIESWDLMDAGKYDVVLFDVLGDVVCGGFAAPLRKGFGDRVLIVASEDEMSFYAANNISKAVVRYAANGVALAGLVINQRGPAIARLSGPEFANRIGSQVMGTLPISNAIEEGRQRRQTLMEFAPTEPYSKVVQKVANELTSLKLDSLSLPTPMEPTDFQQFVTGDAPRIATATTAASKLDATTDGPDADLGTTDSRTDHAPVTTPDVSPVIPLTPGPGKQTTGGPGSRQVFAGLLAFGEKELTRLEAKVHAVVVKADGDIWLTLEVQGLGPTRIMVRPPDKNAFVRNRRLGISYGDNALTPQLQRFLRHTAKHLGRHTFAQLTDVIYSDPHGTTDAGSGEEGRPKQFDWNVRAGSQALAALAERLPGITIADSKVDGAIELTVDEEEAGQVVVSLQPLESGSGLVSTKHFSAGYQGGTAIPGGKAVVESAAQAFEALSLKVLQEIIRESPGSIELGRPGSSATPTEAEIGIPLWASFFAAEQFARNVFHLFRINVPHVTIEHCDQECNYATPVINNNEHNFLNYPWLSPGQQAEDPYLKNIEPGHYFTTHLKEIDVISGSTDKLTTILDEVVDNLGDEQLIMLNNTCVPVIAGDDVDSLVKGLSKRCPVPIMSMGSHIGDDPFVALFKKLRSEQGFETPPVNPHSLNLVGFPATKGSPELVQLLARAGISINSRAFPEVELTIFHDYLAAPLQVQYPLDHFAELYSLLLGELPLQTIAPAAPYGIEATRRWLAEVGKALGCEAEVAQAVTESWQPLAERWQAIRVQASRQTLGFVLAGDAPTLLSTPGRCHGIPILEWLAEAGFQLHFLLHEETSDETLPGGEIARFSTREELSQQLAASPAQAFYTDYYFDHRLAGAGKSQFSLQFFELGFEGTLRTAEKLIRICDVPFFARYGRYGRTAQD